MADTKKETKKIRGVYEYPEGSGVWWIQFFADGRRHREKVGRRSAAKDLLHKRKSDVREGVKMPKTMRAARVIRFDELAQDAIKYSEAHKSTSRQDKSYWATMEPIFGHLTLDEMTPAAIDDYLISRDDIAPATLNRYRSFLSMAFQQAIRNGKAERNPARMVKLRRENNARIRFLTFEEEGQLRRIILDRTPTHEPAFTFAVETGMRMSEQHSMTWDQVDFKRRQVFLEKTKNGSGRAVVLSDRAVWALKAMQARRKELQNDPEKNWKPTNQVWLSRYGEPLGSPIAWFKLVMEDARKANAEFEDVTWHVFRHTFISRLVMAGVDLRTTAELAGHKQIAMTMRYAHLAPSHKINAVEMLAEYRRREEALAARERGAEQEEKQSEAA